MATNIWQGSDGNWDTGGNWSNAAKPAANDVCIFPSTVTQSVTSNHTNENAIDVDLLMLAPGFTGNIGGSGSLLSISADQLTHHGSGALWYSDGDGTTDEFLMDGPGTATISGTAVTTSRILRGTVTYDGSFGASTLIDVGFAGNQASDANVTLTSGAGTCTTLQQWGGTVTTGSTITTLNQHAGTHIGTVDATLTNINLWGGTCRYDGAVTITTANVYGGLLDLSRGDRLVTITTLNIYPGADVSLNKETVTVTTENDFRKVS